MILFSSVSMPPTAVDTFAPVALSAKLSFLSLGGHRVFADGPVLGNPSPDPGQDLASLLESRVGVLSQLLDVRANVVESEARRLEDELVEARRLHAEAAEASVALALSEARKTAILEGSWIASSAWSQGQITEFNRAAESTFGCSAPR